MKHMNSRRILAMLLALCMMVGMLSMTAFATDAATTGSENSGATTVEVSSDTELKNAFKNATDGQTIKLTANITGKYLRTISKRVTIDLNGQTWEVTGNYCTLQLSGAGADVTVIDSAGGGVIKNSYSKSGGNSYVVDFISSTSSTAGTFTLKSGTIETTSGYTSIASSAIGNISEKACTVNIEGGTILVPDAAKNGRGIVASNGMTLNVSGGEIIGGSYGIDLSTGASATITGGTIRSKTEESTTINKAYAIRTVGTPSLTIGGGETTPEISGILIGGNTTSTDTPTIVLKDGNVGYFYNKTGTEFKVDASQLTSVTADETIQAFLPSGCTYNAETGEVTKEASEVYVAYIGTQGYTTLEAAIKAANEGDTINLTAGEFTTAGEFRSTKSLTFVGAGADQTTWTIGNLNTHVNGEANGDYSFENAENITFKNMTLKSDTDNYRGFIRIKNSVVENCTIVGKTTYWGYVSATFKNVTFNAPEGDYAVWIYSSPKVSFESCTFNTSGKTIHVYNDAQQLPTAEVVLKDCEVTTTKASGNKAIVNIKKNTVGTTLNFVDEITVTGKDIELTETPDLFAFNDAPKVVSPSELTDSYVYEITTDGEGNEVSKTQLATTAKATGVAKITRDGADVGTYATLAEAFEKAEDGDTITLLSDCSGNGLMVAANRFAGSGLTVDFGGHTYTFNGTPVGSTGSETQAAHFESDNKITLKNGKFNVSGETDANGYKVVAPLKILLQNYADLTLDSMILDGTNVSTGMEDLITLSTNNGAVEIIDTQIIAPDKPSSTNYNSYAISVCGFQSYTGTSVKVTGSENGTSTITGNIKLIKEGTGNYNLKLELDKGTSTGKLVFKDITPENVMVSKTSNFTVGAPDGYEWSEDGTLVAKETPENPVAETGGTQYATLQKAIDEAAPGATVTLMADITVDESVVINKSLKLKFDHHTITGGTDVEVLKIFSSDENTIKVKLQGNRDNEYEDGKQLPTGGINGGSGGDNIAVSVGSNAEVTIRYGTYTVGGDANGEGNSTIYVYDNGIVNIVDGGTFSSEKPYRGLYYVLNRKNGCTGTFNVKAGTFVNYNPLKGDDNDGGNFCAVGKGLDVSLDSNNKPQYTVKSGFYQVLDINENPVKVYNSAEMATMLLAIQDGQTIMLLRNTTANITIPADKDFTLDLNGKTLNGGTGTAVATITNYGKVTITDSSADKTGKIMRDDAGVEGEKSYYVIHNLGTMTIKNGTIYNNSGYKKANSAGVMTGSSLICNSDDDAYPATLNIEGGTLEQANFIAIKNGSSGTLFMTGGTVKSGHSAIQNWHDATITGGKVIGQLWTDSYIDKFSTGKTVFGGEAEFEGEIVVDAYYGDVRSAKPTMEITGGNLNVTKWTVGTKASAIGAKPEVSGGTFTSAVPANYCKDGFVPATLDGGKYGVERAKGDVKLIKTDGTTSYIYLADAGSAAVSGDKIELFDNVKTSMAHIKTGVTLDLNGYVLEADFIMAASGQVIDSTEGQGLLKVNDSEILLNKANPNLPLFDSDAAGYRLFSYEFDVMRVYQSATDVAANKVGFYFNLKFSAAKAYELLKGTEHGLSIYVPIKVGVDTDWQYVKLLTSTVQDWVAKGHIVYFVKLRGVDGLESGTVVYAATSVRTCGVDNMSSELTYTKN